MLMKNNFIIISLSYIISYNLNNNNNKKKKIKKKKKKKKKKGDVYEIILKNSNKIFLFKYKNINIYFFF